MAKTARKMLQNGGRLPDLLRFGLKNLGKTKKRRFIITWINYPRYYKPLIKLKAKKNSAHISVCLAANGRYFSAADTCEWVRKLDWAKRRIQGS